MLCNGPSKGAHRPGATASLQACANTAEPAEPHSQGVKDHRAAPHLHGDPRQLPTGRRHPRPPAVQHPRDADRPRCSSQARPRRRRREAADMDSRPSDGPPRLPRSAPPPGHRLHPRHGEAPPRSAAHAMHGQMSSRTLKLAAQQMPSRNSAPCRFGAPDSFLDPVQHRMRIDQLWHVQAL